MNTKNKPSFSLPLIFRIVALSFSFLPQSLYAQDSRTSHDQKKIETITRAIAELEAEQVHLIQETQTRSGKPLSKIKEEVARGVSSINSIIAKTYISPTTKNIGLRNYYKSVSEKIEIAGTCNFPKINGKKIYGELIAMIPIFEDGSIYRENDGIMIKKSSGNSDLDAITKSIIESAAPFDPIPNDLLVEGKYNVFLIVARFSYTSNGTPIEGDVIDCK